MAENLKVTVDKLPIKRLDAIDENGTEHFAPEISQEEKPLTLLRRIDFGMSIEKDAKKSKSSNESQPTPAWPWKGLMKNLHQAQQELSIVIDLISHVEANDAVTVAGMTRTKQLPNELLSDFSISASTKLQSFLHVRKYLKQTAKASEEQVAREARFYGALMRLQRNWKVKRQRIISAGPGGYAGFTIDLSDHSSTDFMLGLRTSSLSTVHIDQDQYGTLAVHLSGKTCVPRSLIFRFERYAEIPETATISSVKSLYGCGISMLLEDMAHISGETNLLFVESPVGVGFYYSNTSSDYDTW